MSNSLNKVPRSMFANTNLSEDHQTLASYFYVKLFGKTKIRIKNEDLMKVIDCSGKKLSGILKDLETKGIILRAGLGSRRTFSLGNYFYTKSINNVFAMADYRSNRKAK